MVVVFAYGDGRMSGMETRQFVGRRVGRFADRQLIHEIKGINSFISSYCTCDIIKDNE
jgi:hypothetical protein